MQIPLSKGFTLIEILIVVAIVGMIISFGTILDLNILKGDEFRKEQSLIVSILGKARSRAMANKFEAPHGVCYMAGDYIIFYDGDCDKSEKDEKIPANINIAENAETTSPFPTVVFKQLTGNTDKIIIHIEDGKKSADIKINEEGTINW